MLKMNEQRWIRYDILGSSKWPVVCFVHALMTDGGFWAAQVEPLLAARMRVLRVDLPGHGGSDSGSGKCTMAGLAEDICAIAKHLDIAQFHYVGLSIGGMIGQALAIYHPDQLKSLFLADTTAASAPGAREMWAARAATIRESNSLESLADVTMERVFTASFKTQDPVRWAELRDTILGTRPDGLLRCAEALQDFNFLSALPKVRVPTMVVCGDGDIGTPPAEAKRIAALIPGARYEEIMGARHYPNIERADRFNSILLPWLEGHENGRAAAHIK